MYSLLHNISNLKAKRSNINTNINIIPYQTCKQHECKLVSVFTNLNNISAHSNSPTARHCHPDYTKKKKSTINNTIEFVWLNW